MSRDLRKYSRQTNLRLLVGFFVVLFLIGDGLIYLIYGRGAAVFGLFCLLIGIDPLLLIWGILLMMELVVKKAGDSDELEAPIKGDNDLEKL